MSMPPNSDDRSLPGDASRLLTLKRGELTPQQVRRISSAALAYLGDAVYELYVRQFYLFPPQRTRAYHQCVVAQVRAERQAQHLQEIEPYLTEEEKDAIRRGRNATVKSPKRLDPVVYQQATGLETLVGYLYLCDPQRLLELFDRISLDPHPSQGSSASDS
ncbi:Mini-ribonuclease 3 [Baaleninema sp.]|uniref:Mini-ribonuclease 3 n=1 Tax=Baaleninema sp. TaxID=3101197 RepID=UPI003D05E35A